MPHAFHYGIRVQCYSEELNAEYVDKPSVWQYVEGGWCGLTFAWRKLWPNFGRFFNYGHVNTINIVELSILP